MEHCKFPLMFVTLIISFLWSDSRQEMEVDGKEGEEVRKKAAEVGPGWGWGVLGEKEEERSIYHMKWMQS